MPHEFAEPTVAIIKHTNPSGLAAAESLVDAYRLAFACDPVSAFGSIIAVNREVDRALVEEIGSLFVEVLAAPGDTPEALAAMVQHLVTQWSPGSQVEVTVGEADRQEWLLLRAPRIAT